MTDAKTFLLISHEYPPVGGGAANAAGHYAQELAQMGHKVVVLTSGYGTLPERERREGVVIIRLAAKRHHVHKSNPFEMFFFILLALFSLGSIVKEFDPDHALIFFVSPFGLLGLALKEWHDLPFSVFARGGDIPGFVEITSVYHSFLQPLTDKILEEAEHVFTNGVYLKQLTDRLLEDKEAINIPNGLDAELSKPKEVGDELKLLFVGRMVQSQKNFMVLPEILKQATDLNLHLYMIGDGPDLHLFKSKIYEYGLQDKVTMLKWLNKASLAKFYELCDVLIFPSVVEGVSNVLVEALASGLYVLANDIPDTRYFLEETRRGYLMRTNQPEEYVDLLRELYHEPGRIEVGINKTVLEELSWQKSTEKLVEHMI